MTEVVCSELIAGSYFAAVLRGMIRIGFTLISQVEITSQTHRFHVPLADGTTARNLRIFFRAPACDGSRLQATMVVGLEFDEHTSHIGKEHGAIPNQPYKGCSVHFYSRHRSWEYLYLAPGLRDRWYPEVDDGGARAPGIVPGVDRELGIPEGFDWENGLVIPEEPDDERQVSFKLRQSGWMPTMFPRPRVVVGAAKSLLRQFAPVVDSGRFGDLQVTSFPPYYTFKGCEADFWTCFGGRRTTNSFASRPWGSAL